MHFTMNVRGRIFRKPCDGLVFPRTHPRNGLLLRDAKRAHGGAIGRTYPAASRIFRLDQVFLRRRAELDYVDYRDLNGIHAKEEHGHLSNGAVDSAFEELDKDIEELETTKPAPGVWQKFGGVRALMSYLSNRKELGQRGEGLFLVTILAAAFAFFPPIYLKGLSVATGCIAVAYGVVAAVAGIVALGRSFSPLAVPRPDVELVTRGVFRFVRHPFYSGLVSSALGFSLISGNEFRFIMTAVLYWILNETIKGEERDLEVTYPEYAAYKSRVGKWIPYVG